MRYEEYPVYPSAKATLGTNKYSDAMRALANIRKVFFDGKSILVPESNQMAIKLLREKFQANIEYGYGREYEFITQARATDLPEELCKVGNVVQDICGLSVDMMLKVATEKPEETISAWREIYLNSMKTY